MEGFTTTATAHTGCPHCAETAEHAAIYARAGGTRSGTFRNSRAGDDPAEDHWAAVTREPTA